MGCCSSSQTSQTTIPEPTPEERALLGLSNTMMQAYLESSGFEVTRTQQSFEDSDEGKSFANQRQQLQQQIDDLNSRISEASSQTTSGGPGKAVGRGDYDAISQLNNGKNGLYAQMNQLEEKEREARAEFKPAINYATREKADFETEEIRKKFGADSPQYREAYERYSQNKINTEKTDNDIKSLLAQKTKKLLSGDYGLNAGEQAFMDELLGPMKEAGLNAINYIESAQTSDQGIGKALTAFADQIKQTGMDMGDAVLALENRVRQTGVDMNTALDEEVATTRELNRMGVEDYTSAQRRQISSQAALLGRSPTDPEFQNQLQDLATRAITQSNLQVGAMAADKRIGIASQTGQGLENAQNIRLGIAERTGQGLEGVAQARVGYADEAAHMKGQLDTSLAGQESSIRSNLAYGLPPQQVGMGMDVANFQNALNQQRLQNIQTGYSLPMNTYNTAARERMAQPTTTQTSTPSVAGTITGMIGAGMSGVGAAGSLGWRPFG
jgi:hypothetical protein